VPERDFLADSGFTNVFGLSRGVFAVLSGADASVFEYSRGGMASSVVGMGIDGEIGLGIHRGVISGMLVERTGEALLSVRVSRLERM